MITLDITGFYYSFQVPYRNDLKTVFDLMKAAMGEKSNNGGIMTFSLEEPPKDDFLSSITVKYGPTGKPTSRQTNLDPTIPPLRPTGTYSFTDDVTKPANRISSGEPGGVPGLLTWQYYIIDKNGVLQSGAGSDRKRTIVPMKLSDKNGQRALQDGDTVVWRLVGIFGLNQFFDRNMKLLVEKSNGKPLGVKAAFEIFKAEKVDLSSVFE
jgi:hypothetical protein